jgi:hypothetical protein
MWICSPRQAPEWPLFARSRLPRQLVICPLGDWSNLPAQNFRRPNIPIFRTLCYHSAFPEKRGTAWNRPPGRRLNVLGRAARRKRIFQRLREGWAYDEIAGEERLSAERVRQIVAEVLGKRVIDRGVDHAHLQLERLMPALRIVGEAIGRGELKAVAPLIKVIDRLDKHQDTVVAKHSYGPEERQRLLDKVNRLVDNLTDADDAPAEPTGDHENNFAENPS